MISIPQISDSNTRTAFNVILKELNTLQEAVNAKQQSLGFAYKGKEGDTQIVESNEKDKLFLINTRDGWYSSFAECFQSYSPGTTPKLHLRNLEVDNLYAKLFTVNQTQIMNGEYLMTDGAVVESAIGNTITFKDQTNLNLCPFVANDKCEIKQVSANKSLTIKLSQFTVNSVSGRTVTVTYETGSPIAAVGDVVVRKGNSSTVSRQNAIYFNTNVVGTPYIDLYTGTTGFTFGTPKVSIGDLTHITDADFGGALVGDGAYLTNAYIKGKVLLSNQASIAISGFNNDAGFITSADAGNKVTYSSTAPSTPHLNDVWFDTSTSTYIMKIYNGSTWTITSCYFDGTGAYVGNLSAGQITTGTLQSIVVRTAPVGSARLETATTGIFWYKADNTVGGSAFHTGSGDIYVNGTNSLSLSGGGQVAVSVSATNLIVNSTGIYWGSDYLATQAWVNGRGFYNYITWTDVNSKPSTFAPSAHNNSAHSETYVTAAAFSNSANADNLISTAYGNATFTTSVMSTWKAWVNTTTIQYKDWSNNNQSIAVPNLT